MTAVTKIIAQPAALVRVMAVGMRGLPGDAEGIPGADGASAYEVAVANGFVGDEAAWLASLVGATGATGATGPAGPAGDTGPAGATGATGPAGADGDSAYEIAVANGFVGDETAWLASLVGATGATGSTGPAGPAGETGPAGATGATGPAGADGDSAYEIAVANGFVGDQTAWLASLVGATGATGATGPAGSAGDTGPAGATGATGPAGADGDSAYEIAVANGFVGDETAWLASLVGATGATGATGPAGADGADAVVAGSTGEVQFNTGGSLDAESDFSYDKTTNTLSVPTLAVGAITGPNSTTGTGIAVGEGSDARSLSLTPGDSAPTFAAGMSVMQVLHEGNVKTVNGESISGSGDISVGGGSAPAGGYHPSPLLYAPGGYKFIPGKSNAGGGTNQNYAASGGKVTLIPFVAPRNMTVTDMSVSTSSTTGSGTAYSLGIYSSGLDGNIDVPGTLLDSATGTIAAPGANTLTINATLTAGSIYWAALGLSATTNLSMILSGSDYSAFGPLFTSQGGGNYAYIAATSTIPSSVASGDLAYQGGAGNMPCIWIGWEPA